ncbi:MAG: nicotinic acid mononucleotide adenylyltransferase, partial [Bacteroidetes bacterium]|nr:nicotinic acid mononucleotide adenylyltransferase [Bacteroidota bacterium]
HFKLIIGEDNLENFPKWKNHQQILSQYGLLVYPRPGAANSQLFTHSNVKVIDAPKIDISATFIRDQISKNKSVKYLIPESVWVLIEKKKLYH